MKMAQYLMSLAMMGLLSTSVSSYAKDDSPGAEVKNNVNNFNRHNNDDEKKEKFKEWLEKWREEMKEGRKNDDDDDDDDDDDKKKNKNKNKKKNKDKDKDKKKKQDDDDDDDERKKSWKRLYKELLLEYDQLLITNQELITKANRLMAAYEAMVEENGQLTTAYDQMVQENNRLTHAYQTMQADYNALQITNEQLASNNRQLSADLETMKAANHQLKADYDNLLASVEPLRQRVQQLIDENKTLTDIVDPLRQENTALKTQNQELQELVVPLQTENATLQANNAALQGENDTLQTQNATLQGENDTLQTNNANLQGENDTLTTDNIALQEENEALRASNQPLLDEIQRLEDLYDEMVTANQLLSDANTALTTNNQDLMDANSTLEADNQTLRDSNTALLQTNDDLVLENSDLSTANDNLADENTTLSEQNADLNDTIDDLNEELDEYRNNGNKPGPSQFEFAVIGDAPNDADVPLKFGNLTQDINSETNLSFTIHLGDFKGGTDDCSDSYITARRDLLDLFEKPLVYTPGDNDWTDCHNVEDPTTSPLQNYYPPERLTALRSIFYPVPGQSLGQAPLAAQTQADFPPPFPANEPYHDPQYYTDGVIDHSPYIENMMWSEKNVLFATFHVTSSKNGLDPWSGYDPDDSFLIPRADRLAEFKRREAATIDWMKTVFADAMANNNAAVVISFHANPAFEQSKDHKTRQGYNNIQGQLKELSRDFGKPVLLLHGDGHRLLINHPVRMTDVNGVSHAYQKFTRVQAYGTPNLHWVRIMVDTSKPEIFSFEMVEVESNLPNLKPYTAPAHYDAPK